MATIREIAERYNVTKATVRNWIAHADIEGVLGTGKPINLNSGQVHLLDKYVAENGLGTVTKHEGETVEAEPLEQLELTSVEALQERIHELEIEVARLEEQLKAEKDKAVSANQVNRLLEDSTNQLVTELKNRAEAAEKALEREQNISRGFWSRLGRKLLGEGKKEK